MTPPPHGDAAYRSAQHLARGIWKLFSRLDVAGLENVPRTGPFLLICNHQSNLDPILIQAVCPRAVHAMAKSSQFAVPGISAVMRRLLSFPVRRYQTDPQAVRLVLRRLREGQGVAIYIEGERSWDGRLQPARLGTIRLILKAGVPVIPCTVAGSYEAWPRWHTGIRPHPVRITFGAPLTFPKLDRKADREPLVPATANTVMTTLARQLGALDHAPGPSPLQAAS
jgi:1-acyl-sn-glycerol-3-phosphate acyltransferase